MKYRAHVNWGTHTEIIEGEMAFENDPEGRRMAMMYGGSDFDKPRRVRHEVLCEYDGDWTLDEFKKLIERAIASIPAERRAEAKVEMHDPGYDGSTSLKIYYEGPESPEVVADRVRRCEQYVATGRADERKAYERLKAKFESGKPNTDRG